MYKIIDFVTKKEVKPSDLVFTGEKNPWEIVMDMEIIKSKINLDYFVSTSPRFAKYLPFMPIQNPAEFVSLRENATPLIESKRLGKRFGIKLYFKLEGKNPTGSFKDRGSAVDITVAKEMGAKGIILASTGNMAASCSCYSAAAKIPCFVVVPEDVSMNKLAQVIAFGGRIVQVKGTYNDAAELAHWSAKKHNFYLGGDYAFRVEGQKAGLFELIDQLNLHVPDRIIIPVGCGTNIAAYAKGLLEYQWLGLINKLPKLVGMEATGANSLVHSFRENLNEIIPLKKISTIASAIAVSNPLDGLKALEAIRMTNGEAEEVTDKEMLEAQYLLSKEEGLFVESASASTLAYLIKRASKGELAGETVVCILTGEGLKDANVVMKSAIKPPLIYPEVEEFTKLYESNFFSSKTMIFVEKTDAVFESIPSKKELKKSLHDLFGLDLPKKPFESVNNAISDILKKGKVITILDLQDIVQDALERVETHGIKSFSIIDFNLHTRKDQRPLATVKVLIRDVVYEGASEGVGSVDAVIKAVCKACHGAVHFELTEYKINIRSHGTDALVSAEIKLLKDGITSMGRATSSDIIQATLVAFEDAYNGFPTK